MEEESKDPVTRCVVLEIIPDDVIRPSRLARLGGTPDVWVVVVGVGASVQADHDGSPLRQPIQRLRVLMQRVGGVCEGTAHRIPPKDESLNHEPRVAAVEQ